VAESKDVFWLDNQVTELPSSPPMSGKRVLRLSARVASVAALGVMLGPSPAIAGTADALEKCGEIGPMRANAWSPFAASGPGDDPVPVLPIDAQPWIFAECAEPDLPFDCVLEHTSLQEVVELTAEGLEEACDDPYQTTHLLRLVPAQLLRPSSRYTLRCKSTPLFADYTDIDTHYIGATLATRSTRSSPPIDLLGAKAELVRRDDTCCGSDPLHLLVTPPESDEAATFDREGGVLEVLLEGDVWYLRPGGGELPWTEEGITLTSIAADGTRGRPLEIPASMIPEELVLNNFDCALSRRLSGSALWLLMPLFFLRWSRRHARRREDRRYGR